MWYNYKKIWSVWMAVIKFKKREEPIIEFGIRLPRIVYNLMSEIKNKKKAEEIVRETFNVNKNRLINIVEARDATDDVAMILVVYKNIMASEKDLHKFDLEVMDFNFIIFEFDFNMEIDVEKVIKDISKGKN